MIELFERWRTLADYLRSILRIAAGFAFTLHGTMKLFAFPAKMGSGIHVFSQMGLAGILEVFGGGLMVIGLFSRPVAFILSGEMAVAFFQVHFPRSFWPILSGGELAMLYCFIWLYFSAAGPGPWSIDAIISRSRN